MEIGKVIGSVWATKKDEGLNGVKLVVLQLLKDEITTQDYLMVAADIIGAGVGDLVIVSRGSAARQAVNNQRVPIDAAIVGIVDSLEIHK